MSKHASPTVVGGFVVGAVVLGIGGLLAFGSGSWFQKQLTVVAHFPSSLAGLDVGAPVRFRGIKIGTVTDIEAVWNENADDIRIPVQFDLDGDAISAETVSNEILAWDSDETLNYLIEKGLRAELQQDSFVTGKLYVALDFSPDEPVKLLGGTDYPEIPTIETELARLKKSLEELPIEELVDSAVSSVHAIEDLVNDPRVGLLLDDLHRLLTKLEERIDPLADSLQATLDGTSVLVRNADDELKAVSEDLLSLLSNTEARVGPLSDSASSALEEARVAIAKVSRLVGDDYTLFYRLADLLEEFTGAARAVRVLAAYLERHPEAILSGRGQR